MGRFSENSGHLIPKNKRIRRQVTITLEGKARTNAGDGISARHKAKSRSKDVLNTSACLLGYHPRLT